MTEPTEQTNHRQLVDLHAHPITDEYREVASRAGHHHPEGMPYWPSWSVDSHLALMDSVGIGRAFLSISTPGVHFGDDVAGREFARQTNLATAQLAALHPDRFGHFGSLPLPDVEGSMAEARFVFDEIGAQGVAVLSNAHGVYLGDERFAPLWADLDAREALVFVHPTSPPNHASVSCGRPRPVIEFLFDTARTVVDLILSGTLTTFPNIRFVFTHAGGVLPLVADRVELFRTVFGVAGSAEAADVRTQLATLWFDTAGTPFPRQVPALADLVGTEQIVYGSDHCWTPAPAVAAQIRSLAEAPGAWLGRTTENAQRLLSARHVEAAP